MKRDHVLVFGGTKGHGRALVRLLSERHQPVSLFGRHASPEVETSLPELAFYEVNLADENCVREAVRRSITERGKISHIVFYQRFRGEGDPWQSEIQVSLTATKAVIEECEDNFRSDDPRSIVVVTSAASRFVFDEQPAGYHAAKAALTQLVRFYAVKLGPKGIRVNSVSPDTFVKEESQDFYNEQIQLRKLYEAITPLGRMGNSLDVAHVVDFLCSAKAAFITGQEIVVDGGLSLVGQSVVARKVARLDLPRITR